MVDLDKRGQKRESAAGMPAFMAASVARRVRLTCLRAARINPKDDGLSTSAARPRNLGGRVAAANPSTSLHHAIQVSNGGLSAAGRLLPLEGRLIVVGAGKAAARMAQVVEEIAGNHITGGLVVTKYGHRLDLNRIRLVEAGHPIPDENGVRAVRDTQALLTGLTPDDLVLSLISGGGSALWPSPAEGITLEEKQQMTQMLLRAGATIQELNGVRKHLSGIKGGHSHDGPRLLA